MQSVARELRAHEPRTETLIRELDGLRGAVDPAVLDHVAGVLREGEQRLHRLAERLETQAQR
jgi:hypothetical protein